MLEVLPLSPAFLLPTSILSLGKNIIIFNKKFVTNLKLSKSSNQRAGFSYLLPSEQHPVELLMDGVTPAKREDGRG